MFDDKCPVCVKEFLSGGSQCSRCGAELLSPVGQRRDARLRSADELFISRRSASENEPHYDDENLESVLFDWKNPVTLNIVGSLVCTLILIATLLEL